MDYTAAGGYLDMADLYVRNLDNTAIKKLDESAKKRGISRNKLIVGILTNYALASEVKELDSRYQELFKIVIDTIEGNTMILHDILVELKRESNDNKTF